MLGDTLGSIGAIVASILIFLTGFVIFDVLVSLLITGLILISAYNLLKDSGKILMESTPGNFDLHSIEKEIINVDSNILAIHDTHIWSTSLNHYNFSCHVIVSTEMEPCKLIDKVNDMLTKNYDIHHCTIQIEHDNAILECGSC